MVPEGAILEEKLTDQVALYDASHLLAHGPGDYKFRPPEKIDKIFIHKSGADGPAGFDGLKAMARYTTAEWGRHWPGAPYTFWFSRTPDVDHTGRLVVYRAQPDHLRTYHTGGAANGRGVAGAFQGAYDGEWDLLASGRPRVEVEPTDEQMTCAEAWLGWALHHYALTIQDLSGHWEASKFGGHDKPICPGDFLRAWVLTLRGELPEAKSVPAPVEAQRGEVRLQPASIKDLQRALALVGHNPGPIDGIWGHRSRHALERLQHVTDVTVDGWFGPITAAALLTRLRRFGLSRSSMFDHYVKW